MDSVEVFLFSLALWPLSSKRLAFNFASNLIPFEIYASEISGLLLVYT